MSKRIIVGLLALVLCGCACAQSQPSPAPAQPAAAAPHQSPAAASTNVAPAPEPLTPIESLELRIAAQQSLIRESRMVLVDLEKQLAEARKEDAVGAPYKAAEARVRAAHGYGKDVKIVFDNRGNPTAVSR